MQRQVLRLVPYGGRANIFAVLVLLIYPRCRQSTNEAEATPKLRLPDN